MSTDRGNRCDWPVWLALALGSLQAAATPVSKGAFSMDDLLTRQAAASLAPGPQDPIVTEEIEALKNRAMSPVVRLGTRAEAAWLLGLIQLHGAGVRSDPAQAQSWFESAQALGHGWAAGGLAWCEIEGCQKAANPAGARRWLRILQDINLPRAQYLEWLVETRSVPDPARPVSPTESDQSSGQALQTLLILASQGGDIHALIERGLQAIAQDRLGEALDFFNAAAPRSAVAATNAALVRERLQARQESATSTATSAAGLLAAARRSHRGEGQPANYTEAIRLYQLAKNRGSIEAQKMLALIYSRPDASGQLDINWMKQLAYLDLSGDSPRAISNSLRPGLQREPTPLIDQLPLTWRERTSPLPP